ncbi:MAG: DUF1836 domain-containing protein [Ruminococcaceae bacterium]|nr:DUF1836 domain-containing protein [Oscillospiraceae bacterium]
MKRPMNEEMARGIEGFRLPRYGEIPDVGLFLEQTTKYVSGVLAPLGGLTVTSSMISNYVKKKLIESPVKKQYSREQIAYLIFIAMAKGVMPLEGIQTMLRMQKERYDVQVAYDYFCNEFESVLALVFGLKDTYENVGAEHSEYKTILRNAIIALVHKVYLDRSLAILQSRDDGE